MHGALMHYMSVVNFTLVSLYDLNRSVCQVCCVDYPGKKPIKLIICIISSLIGQRLLYKTLIKKMQINVRGLNTGISYEPINVWVSFAFENIY